MRRSIRLAVGTAAAVSVLALGCSKGDEQGGGGTTPPSAASGTTVPSAADDPADAKSAAVEYFEAEAVNDYDKAQSRASGAAAAVIEWARGVNAIQATQNTP